MTNKLLNNLYDGVDLALPTKEATENKIESEKRILDTQDNVWA